MFHSQFELENLAHDRLNTMAAKLDHAEQLRELKSTDANYRHSAKLTQRVRHGLGRSLIAVGEHLVDRPAPPAASCQLTSARPR